MPLLLLIALSPGCAHMGGPAMRPHARADAATAPAAPESAPGPESATSPETRANPDTAAAAGAATTSRSWLLPVRSFGPDAIIGRFGDSRDGGDRRHEGIDIRANRGTPVLAPFAGRVVVSGRRSRSGNLVMLLGEDGTELLFAHLDRRDVERGERVSAGQRLGTVGDTGNARGTPHLHLEVHTGAGPVDPYPLFTGAAATAGIRR